MNEAKTEAEWIVKNAQEKAEKYAADSKAKFKEEVHEEAKRIIEKEIASGNLDTNKDYLKKTINEI